MWWRRFFPAGSFAARLADTGPRWTVDRFVDPGPTPGRVGVCLSGGGSRALTAGMGQLRALKHLKTSGGASLLGMTRALSTVSGGSWVGVPFEFLTEGASDDDYLNRYVADLGRLVPSRSDGHSQAETLDELPVGNIGVPLASRSFAPARLGIQALLLHEFARVPAPLLWQTLVALHLLRPYGLFVHGRHLRPKSLFSFDAATLARDVVGPNPKLAGVRSHLFASGPKRVRRPFLVCNASMFLHDPAAPVELLAPVQATAFVTGILGAVSGSDANGRAPGGGGVTSFAFGSNPTAVDGKKVTVAQERQLALMDVVGTSSAFFAEMLQNLFADWRSESGLERLLSEIREGLDDILEWLESTLRGERLAVARRRMSRERLERAFEHEGEREAMKGWLASVLDRVQDLIPEYAYWPVRDAAPAAETRPTRFADGGNLENTGVASLLSYEDIARVIAFVNSATPLAAGARGVMDADGDEVPGTRVVVDGQLPGLFGYQVYDAQEGYVLYSASKSPRDPEYAHNQVFPAAAFAELLKGLWAASGNEGDPALLGASGGETKRGLDLRPAIWKQALEVRANPWFGVRGGRTVDVVWCYTNRVRVWYDALSPAVRQTLGSFEDPSSFDHFPHYSTFRTHLTATQINLLASLTAWSVGDPANRQVFVDLFDDGAS